MLIGLARAVLRLASKTFRSSANPWYRSIFWATSRSISLWSTRMRSNILCTSSSMLKKTAAESAMSFAV